MRLPVIILLLLGNGMAVAQQYDSVAAKPLNNGSAAAGKIVFRVIEAPDTAVLFTDTLFGIRSFSARQLVVNDAGTDTVYRYEFSRRYIESVVFNMIDPGRDSVTDQFSGYHIRQFYSGNSIFFVLGADSISTHDYFTAYLNSFAPVQAMADRRKAARKNSAVFSKTARAEETQFDIYLSATDDSLWREPEKKIVKK